MTAITLLSFGGQNTAIDPRGLADRLATSAVNVKPGSGSLKSWRDVGAVLDTVPAAPKTIYRMGRDQAATPASWWLSWSTVVDVIRGFDGSDQAEVLLRLPQRRQEHVQPSFPRFHTKCCAHNPRRGFLL